MNIAKTLDNLVSCLKQADPCRIVLFGSHAHGGATDDSDIDLMVVLDNDDVSATYDDRMKKKLSIYKLVRELNYQTALDIMVYSKAELRKAKEYGNFFIDEIEATGKVIYEKAS
jgi:predicted nucleotidyltransferase